MLPAHDRVDPSTAIARARAAADAVARIGVSTLVTGSLARGDFRSGSDIDFLVTRCPRHLKYAIEGIVEDLPGRPALRRDLPGREFPTRNAHGFSTMRSVRKISSDVTIEFESIASEVYRLKSVLDRLRMKRPTGGSQDGLGGSPHLCLRSGEDLHRLRARPDPHRPRGRRIALRSRRRLAPATASGGRQADPGRASRRSSPRPALHGSIGCAHFRHRERNTYGFDLDLGVVLERSAEAVEAFDIFRAEVTTFLDRDGPSDVPDPS